MSGLNAGINEDLVEQAALGILQDLGHDFAPPSIIAPDGTAHERVSHGEVLLVGRLEASIARINPSIPEEARLDALRKITGAEPQN
jgi:type I restriction enzyme R subunit